MPVHIPYISHLRQQCDCPVGPPLNSPPSPPILSHSRLASSPTHTAQREELAVNHITFRPCASGVVHHYEAWVNVHTAQEDTEISMSRVCAEDTTHPTLHKDDR